MRILIVDDDRLVCSSLKTILEAQGQTIAGIGYSGREALQLYAAIQGNTARCAVNGYTHGGHEWRGCQ